VHRPKITGGVERLNQIAWIVTHWEEVDSDMSRFHRIDDSPSYPNGARWFTRAERLAHYFGAVRAAVIRSVKHPEPRTFDQVPPVPDNSMADELGLIGTYSAVPRSGVSGA